ncbi:MAG: transcription elongation factor GreA [Zetaproteobacteria bacterium CG12_big_fil_rev_8_21_14_0_65_55_1124]|nr:MAG: transcription elongation factor GreA [Zetaproteobacteria bacterium CG1_02_55_237]PIS18545.1 MAG: transcription elongation factor GreA [Zetaproteobacteria bacterium CG08_land_8_20_14_0_20_55_17]PIW42022.1 MAG: transcription elongation factor GreA [Zetaproteobacteria bacterium CG12_big_fil_rev_8_21_14_0_65_55_1124]PIY53927.1 MAG: transcription elongation factor GreA [Zetaproteobacteria bacterium CG_4_10_14_0_8_um_filter_55_43]PIZ39372.1 MAG: transcription elongation factor GreA [Zetaprote
MERVPMTIKGAEALREELKHLKTVNRPRIVEAISTARAHGDLSENAEYHAAKEEQGFNEGRIKDLEDKLARAHVIDTAAIVSDRIVFGATVELIDLETGAEVVYQIVGVNEANIEQGMVSITSPIARALIGKEAGDVASVQAPGGVREYEIQAVDYR